MNIHDAVRQVKKTGIYIVPDFWSTKECEKAIDDIKTVVACESALTSIDKYGADHRIYGFEHLSRFSEREVFLRDELLNVLCLLYGVDKIDGTLLGQYVNGSVVNMGSGASWHRDSYPRQYKIFIFLNDVTRESGAFEYYPGTQTRYSKLYAFFKQGFKSIRTLDYADDEFRKNSIGRGVEPVKLTCARGTLAIVDTSVVHRGSPGAKESRYSITYYAFSKTVPPHIKQISDLARKGSLTGEK